MINNVFGKDSQEMKLPCHNNINILIETFNDEGRQDYGKHHQSTVILTPERHRPQKLCVCVLLTQLSNKQAYMEHFEMERSHIRYASE